MDAAQMFMDAFATDALSSSRFTRPLANSVRSRMKETAKMGLNGQSKGIQASK